MAALFRRKPQPTSSWVWNENTERWQGPNGQSLSMSEYVQSKNQWTWNDNVGLWMGPNGRTMTMAQYDRQSVWNENTEQRQFMSVNSIAGLATPSPISDAAGPTTSYGGFPGGPSYGGFPGPTYGGFPTAPSYSGFPAAHATSPLTSNPATPVFDRKLAGTSATQSGYMQTFSYNSAQQPAGTEPDSTPSDAAPLNSGTSINVGGNESMPTTNRSVPYEHSRGVAASAVGEASQSSAYEPYQHSLSVPTREPLSKHSLGGESVPYEHSLGVTSPDVAKHVPVAESKPYEHSPGVSSADVSKSASAVDSIPYQHSPGVAAPEVSKHGLDRSFASDNSPAAQPRPTELTITPSAPVPDWHQNIAPDLGGIGGKDLQQHGTTLATRDSRDGKSIIAQMSDGTYESISKTSGAVAGAGTWGDSAGGGVAKNGIGNDRPAQAAPSASITSNYDAGTPIAHPSQPIADIQPPQPAQPATPAAPTYVDPVPARPAVSATNTLTSLGVDSNVHYTGRPGGAQFL